MFNKRLTILAFLVVILTSCPVLADKGGFGNGGFGQGGQGEIQENFGIPGRGFQQVVPPRVNDERQNLQPQQEQTKRNYNQFLRKQRQQFQQNWKNIKKTQ